ncbi:MAG: histidine phosphatase family protein [Armatimonadota bacterium]
MADRENRTTVILVRHGETEWNATGRIQGHGDSPLTALGLEQGRRVAERLAREKIAAVYASTLSRARDTGELIAAPHGLSVQLVADLRERSYGSYEGLTLDEIREREPAALATWLSHPNRELLAAPGGENQPQMSARVMPALKEIVAAHPGETVAVAAHGGPIKSAVFAILSIPITAWDLTWVSNGSITVLRGTPEKLRVACVNDTCHLDSVFTPPRSIEG